LIRYEIEKLLISGSVQVADLPSLWNQYYKDYLGLIIPDDARGVLQDVHWSHGSFGYFPTYSLGSIYAAQFFRQATLEIEGLENKIEEGNYAPLLDWLRSKIHVHGKMYRADELCKRITGETINFGHFMNYARSKYGQIYQLENLNALT
jgi:carboxypeptidase Taq